MRAIVIALSIPALVAASAPVTKSAPLLDQQLAVARSEQAAAEASAKRLELAASRAKGEAERLAAGRIAAAQAVDASEARITVAEAELALASARLERFRNRMALAERPAAVLLAGLARMSRRPPILELADRGGVDELIKTRILLDSVLPAVRRRTAGLSQQIARGAAMEQSARVARAALRTDRRRLDESRTRLAALESKALAAAIDRGSLALTAGDTAIAGRERLDALAKDNAASASIAAQIIASGPPPGRPGGANQSLILAPFAYQLPSFAKVTRGLFEIDRGGVRSRGIAIAAKRGAPLLVPADGTIRFAGPYRDYDGVVIIGHADGWITVIVNASPKFEVGAKVRRGEVLGRALGPIEVELSNGGRRLSPAIIAGSSVTLSNTAKGG